MSDTILSSARREVVIGMDRPLVIIGDRINPSGRRRLSAEMKAGDLRSVRSEAIAQAAAGAHMLDVNAGIPLAEEPRLLAECVELVQSVTDVPLCIDSSMPDALEAALAVYRGKALVNSVTGDDDHLERVLPLVKRYGAAVVAVSNDESGISSDMDERFNVALKIVRRARDHGVRAADVVVDPLAMPLGVMHTEGSALLGLIVRLREELKVNTTIGLSNIGFGLPDRVPIETTFLAMSVAAGLSSALMNPLRPELMQGVRAANLMMGRDRQARDWVAAYRDTNVIERPSRSGRRRAGRER